MSAIFKCPQFKAQAAVAATLSLISGNERTVRYYIQYSNPVFKGAVQPSWHRRLPGE